MQERLLGADDDVENLDDNNVETPVDEYSGNEKEGIIGEEKTVANDDK